MKEELLHHVWRMTKFDISGLATTNGERIQIMSCGIWNHNSGPDFRNARIKIGHTLWAGNVEIHVYSSDWTKHKHQFNNAYDNVILHIVYEYDGPIFRKNGEEIPCLKLKDKLNETFLKKYLYLMRHQDWIPCEKQITNVGEMVRNNWLDRLLVERMEQKIKSVESIYAETQQHWEATLIQLLGRSFGTKVNAATFENLLRRVPVKLLWKYSSQPIELEALLFGLAGFFEKTREKEDEYYQKLKRRFLIIKEMYEFRPLKLESWKFSRMRPANFPTIRIAQFVALLSNFPDITPRILNARSLSELEELFEVEPSAYWDTHYVFNKKSIHKQKKIGKDSIRLIIINAVIPYLYYFAIQKANNQLKFKALQILEDIPPEQNKIIRNWEAINIKPRSAYHSQALLLLKQEYCDKKKCLNCAIGNSLLKI